MSNNDVHDFDQAQSVSSQNKVSIKSVPNTEKQLTYLITTTGNSINNDKSSLYKIEGKDEFLWLKLADKGTFGTVYKVKELKTSKIFAIKQVYQDPLYINTEYHILKQLDQVNCIKTYRGYYSQDKHSDKVFLNIVMDYVPTTLYHIVHFYKKREADFPVLLGKIYAYQLFRALLHLENKSIVHRDIKPKNILINPKNHALILADFGSAKIMQSDTLSISYICTRYYRAPELLLGDDSYRHKIDVWAAGCVIAEIFLGMPLFMGKNFGDQLLQIIKVLGTPSKDYIDVLLKKKEINLPPCKGSGLLKKLESVDPLLQDLIAKALVYDPGTRITPLEALIHPCFDDLRAQQILINDKEIVDLFDFSFAELNNDKLVYSKIVPDWHPSRNQIE